MTNHDYKLKFNDEALSQNLRREKLSFLRSTLRWCQERSFVQACAQWIPWGEARIADLLALEAKGPSQVPEKPTSPWDVIVPSKPKKSILIPV